jgi:hypothetical protein
MKITRATTTLSLQKQLPQQRDVHEHQPNESFVRCCRVIISPCLSYLRLLLPHSGMCDVNSVNLCFDSF